MHIESRIMKIALVIGLMAIMLFSLGLPALATTGQPGPTPPALGDPVAATNEVQMVRLLGQATSGTFKLSLDGQNTGDLNYNFRGGDLETALEAINDNPPSAMWDIVDVSVSYGTSQGAGLRGKSYQVTFNNVTYNDVRVYPVSELSVVAGTTPLAGSSAVYGVIAPLFPVAVGNTSITVDEILLPPRTPSFSIKIDNETFTVSARTATAVPGRYVYTVGAAAAAHAAGAKVSSGNALPFVVVETAQNGVGVRTGQVSPHGGYSSVTNYCLQCHAVHSYEVGGTSYEPGEYSLMVGDSVTDTCATCHLLFGDTSGTEAVNSDAITGKPSIPGGMATTSLRSAYDLGEGEYLGGSVVAGHQLGADESPDGVVMFGAEGEEAGPGTASETEGGLYCGSCHTPHGDFGQLINSQFYRSEAGGTGVANEIQRITLDDPAAAGGFTLTFTGAGSTQTTMTPIPYSANALAIQTALEGLSNIDPGDVSVSPATAPPALPAAPKVAFHVQFTGRYAGVNVPALGINNEVQTLTIVPATATGGTFSVDQSGNTNPWATITYDAARTAVDTALETLSSIGSGGVTVAGDPGGPWTVTFNGSATGHKNASPLITDASGLIGPDPLYAVTVASLDGSTADAVSTPTAGGSGLTSPLTNIHQWTTGGTFLEGRTTLWVLYYNTSTGIWQKCTDKTYTSCQNLTTVDMEGQTVYLYGYKLLSMYPNWTGTPTSLPATMTSPGTPESWGMGQGGHDGARWCGTCHPSQMGEEVGGLHPSHPGSCTYCHGNPADGSSFDFPHTSTNGSLLKEYPDALCIVCHSKGTLR